MTPTLLQTQFLKRHITLVAMPIPESGAFLSVGVDSRWFILDENSCLTITPHGVEAFWRGVKKYGRKAILSAPIPDSNPPRSIA